MLRMHGAMQGWTTMRRTDNTRKMSEMINEKIDLIPSELYMPDEGKSLQLVCKGEITNIHFLKTCTHRSEEHCAMEEYQWTCWTEGGQRLWRKTSLNAETFQLCSYYQENTDRQGNESADLATTLALENGIARMRRIPKRSNAHKKICRDNSLCTGRVYVRSFMIFVVDTTTRVYFLSDRIVTRNTERNKFLMPKAVNICYTGTVNGKIQASAVRLEMSQASKRGPCGSEIHIDTSMGVMQIFGNNNGSRKITCKAFLSVDDANFIVRRVCTMVSVSPPFTHNTIASPNCFYILCHAVRIAADVSICLELRAHSST